MLERGWDNFCDFTMETLNKNTAFNLIKNLDYDQEVKDKFLFELKEKDLYEKHQSFCENPLLLTIMLLTYQEFAEIPDKLYIFYGRAFDVLYSKHDATKGSFVREKRLENKGLASDDFKRILSTFSAISYADSIITFEKENLIEYIQKAKEFIEIEFDSNDFLIDLVEAVCILNLDGSEYKYQHRSFQEYFTAKFINNLTDEDQKEFLLTLLSEKSQSMLQIDQVFNMLFEMNQIKMEKNFIIPVLEELKDKINNPNKEQSYIKYLSLIFQHVTIDFTKKGQYQPSLRIGNFENFKYISVIKFVYNRYINKIENIPEELKHDNRKTKPELHKEIYEKRINTHRDEEYKNRITLKFSEAKTDSEICSDIINISAYETKSLEFAFLVLENLKEKNKNRKSMKELFSRTK